MISYDYETRIVDISYKDLVELIRNGRVEGRDYPGDKVKAIVVVNND